MQIEYLVAENVSDFYFSSAIKHSANKAWTSTPSCVTSFMNAPLPQDISRGKVRVKEFPIVKKKVNRISK